MARQRGGARRRQMARSRRSRRDARPPGGAVVLPAPFGPISADPFALPHRRRRDVVDDSVAAERTDRCVQRKRGHAVLRLVRRTTAKNGAPKKAVTTPIGSSAGDITVRAITSARTRNPAPIMSESGRSSAVAAADEQPDRVRDDDPDETDQTGDGDRRRRADRRGDDDEQPDAGHVHAERRGLLVADCEHVEQAPVAQQDQPGRDRRTAAMISDLAPAGGRQPSRAATSTPPGGFRRAAAGRMSAAP